MIINMVVALPGSFMPNEDQLYYVGEHKKPNSLGVAKILLIENEKISSTPKPLKISETEYSVQIIKGPNMADKVILTKPNAEMAYYLNSLFMQGHLHKISIPRMMIYNRAVVNILPTNMMKRLGNTTEDLVPIDIVVSSFIGGAKDT
ncbi:hypothetical protein ACH5RR_039624 [Cinchona calisaya]|uniref:Uncharacterized protein n=1 Tax=Cinchona calisaya TaxID=153742 RepID=A0ABD2Y1C1_9GENT